MHIAILSSSGPGHKLSCALRSSQDVCEPLCRSRTARVCVAAVLRSKSAREGEGATGKETSSTEHQVGPNLTAGVEKRPSLNPISLFPSTHVEQLDPLFVLYFPFGLALAAVRMLLWVVLLFADQAWLTDDNNSIAALQLLLGVDVKWRNEELVPQTRHVLVSNHTTVGDLMALYRRPKRIVHLISTGLPKAVAAAKHHRVDLRHACLETYDLLGTSGEKESIHLFPEGGMTNGQGMMKFSRGFLRFADGLPIVPVALRAELPWGLSTHTLNSSFLSNLFWFCFSPYVRLNLTVLPPTTRKEGEGKAKFVERVQQQIANELRIPILDFTIQAKKKLMQSGKLEKPQSHH